MDIDSSFLISLTVVDSQGKRQIIPVRASDFFDHEDYAPEEWDCDLPWRKLDLCDYVPLELPPPCRIDADIIHVAREKHRRISTQFFGRHQLTLSWDDVVRHPAHFEIIATFTQDRLTSEVARVEVVQGEMSLTHFSIVEEDQLG